MLQFCAELGRSNFVVWADDVSSFRSCWEQDRSDWELCLSRHVGTHKDDLSGYQQVALLKRHHHLRKHFFLSHAPAPNIATGDLNIPFPEWGEGLGEASIKTPQSPSSQYPYNTFLFAPSDRLRSSPTPLPGTRWLSCN